MRIILATLLAATVLFFGTGISHGAMSAGSMMIGGTSTNAAGAATNCHGMGCPATTTHQMPQVDCLQHCLVSNGQVPLSAIPAPTTTGLALIFVALMGVYFVKESTLFSRAPDIFRTSLNLQELRTVVLRS